MPTRLVVLSESFAYYLAGPIVRSWITSIAQDSGIFPWPRDLPVVHVDGPDPLRIVILGDAVAAGVGVSSHHLAITGQLARFLRHTSGRGVDVEAVARADWSVRSQIRLIPSMHLASYDAIVMITGGLESNSNTSRAIWRRVFGQLMNEVTRAAPGVPVVVWPLGHLPASMRVVSWVRAIGFRTTEGMNEVSAEVCGSLPDVTFISPQELPDSALGFRSAYTHAAASIGTEIARMLDQSERHSRALDAAAEQRRQRAFDELTHRPLDVESLEGIVIRARDLLQGSGAAINLVDHDRSVVEVSIGVCLGEVVRTGSFGDMTIRGTGAYVVIDAPQSEFANHPAVTGPMRVRSYIGHPLMAPNGERVGVLSVLGTEARHFTALDVSMLAELSRQAQAVLWKPAHRAPPHQVLASPGSPREMFQSA